MSRHMLDGGLSDQHEQYRILQLVHSLEKGLSYRSPRAFGGSKALSLMNAMASASPGAKGSTAFFMGLSVLTAWVAFHKQMPSADAYSVRRVEEFLAGLGASKGPAVQSGARVIVDRDPGRWLALPIDEFLSTRHSTRRFAGVPVLDSDLLECVSLAMLSPSACNRQMVRLRVIDNAEGKRLLYDTLHGTGGIDYETCRLGVVTFDAQSLDFYGERNQGYLNAGLFAMTLIYAFHWKGIGSCLLQFGNTFAEERMLIRELGIPASERIGVGIAFGVLESSDVVPASARREVDEIVSVLAADALELRGPDLET